jgi:hypothetical protein
MWNQKKSKMNMLDEMAAKGLFAMGYDDELGSYYVSTSLCQEDPYILSKEQLLQLAADITELAESDEEMSTEFPPGFFDRPKSEANWEPYFGNNREEFEQTDVIRLKSMSFKEHLGVPLSQDLWDNLRCKLHITGLCIYRPGDQVWYMQMGPGHCCIYLDKEGLVKDIHF